MSMMIDYELRQRLLLYLDETWKRRWIALGVCVGICLAGWSYVISLPDVFSASGRIYVDTQTVLRPLLSGLTVEADVGSELRAMQETLLNRPNLERLARATDLDVNAKTPEAMERVLSNLKNRIRMSRSAADIYTLTVLDAEAERSKDTVQALMDIFVESNVGRSRQDMRGAQRFLDEQLENYEVQLEEAEQRLADFKQKNMGFLPGSDDYYQRMAAARSDLAAAEARLKEVKSERDVLRTELQALPTMVATTGGGPPSDAGLELVQLMAELQSRQSELGGLLLSYTEEHPDVLALKRRISDLRRKQDELQVQELGRTPMPMGGPAGGPVYGPQVPNPAYTGVQIHLIEKETEIAGLEQAVERRKENFERLESSAMAVPEVEAQLKKLDRDYGVIRAKYDALLQRRESANLTEKRSAVGDSVQFRVVEAPQVPTAPTSPNRPLFLTAVVLVGLVSGIGVAFLLVIMNDTFVDVRGLKEHFDMLPVLGAVTLVGGEGQRGWRTIRRWAFMVSVGAWIMTYGGLMVVEQEVGLKKTVQILADSQSAGAVVSAVSEAFLQ